MGFFVSNNMKRSKKGNPHFFRFSFFFHSFFYEFLITETFIYDYRINLLTIIKKHYPEKTIYKTPK